MAWTHREGAGLQFWSQQPGGTAAADAEQHPCLRDLLLPLHIAAAWHSTCILWLAVALSFVQT